MSKMNFLRSNFIYLVLCSVFLLKGSVLCSQNNYLAKVSELESNSEWSHQVILDTDQNVIVRWKHSEEIDNHKNVLKWITMEVFAPTKGYVGIGFSPNGAMKGSDIVIGWVNNDGTANLKDFYGVGNLAPNEDPQQDYHLLSASETEDGTTIRFKRLWDTCDEEHDTKISTGTTRMIWAFSLTDPDVNGLDQLILDWHGSQRRGVRSVFLVEDAVITPFPDQEINNDVKIWDYTVQNVSVNEEDTAYICKIVKAPNFEKKHQMIGWRPILRKETKQYVHHIVFYECKASPEFGENMFEKYQDHPGGRCYTPEVPSEWTQHCISFLFVWLAGGEGEMLPEHVGHPLGDAYGGATYFMLEIHYDNPDRKSFVDNSGVRIFYTDKLRESDGGIMMMGYSITPFLTIPPAQPTFNVYGICSSECTRNGIPPEGIKLVTVLLHAHLAARKIRLRHIRNGTELPLIAEDNYYDFNYQQSRSLKTEISIMPGDELITECEFETLKRDKPTYGGQSSFQEMCQSFLFYYPRIKLNGCRSQYEFHSYLNGMGIKNVTGKILKAINMPYDPKLLPKKYQDYEPEDDTKLLKTEEAEAGFAVTLFDLMTVSDPSNFKYSTVGEYLTQTNWKKSISQAKSMEESWKNGLHYAYCTSESRRRVPMKSHIIPPTDIKEPLKPEGPSQYCLLKQTQSGSSFHLLNNGLILFSLISTGIATFYSSYLYT